MSSTVLDSRKYVRDLRDELQRRNAPSSSVPVGLTPYQIRRDPNLFMQETPVLASRILGALWNHTDTDANVERITKRIRSGAQDYVGVSQSSRGHAAALQVIVVERHMVSVSRMAKLAGPRLLFALNATVFARHSMIFSPSQSYSCLSPEESSERPVEAR
ncbi:hypothetical protein BDZ45DRAFT_737658 [Acephala macrosclerotiorum]|nr:hypothetical protein BDZ45DRAFT_737658 [Acephala macrosclerotiorum]